MPASTAPCTVALPARPATETREAVLARRFGPAPLRVAETVVGLAASAAAEQGVDIGRFLTDAGWSLGEDGGWRLPGIRGGRSLVEALGAETARALRGEDAWWRVLLPHTRDHYLLAVGGVDVRVSTAVAPEVAAALLRLYDACHARPAYGRQSEARRKLDAAARRGLPAAAEGHRAGSAIAPAYLAAFGTARE